VRCIFLIRNFLYEKKPRRISFSVCPACVLL
jgi:hypothetical protein